MENAQNMLNECRNIMLVVHGSNVPLIDHGAVDIERLFTNKDLLFVMDLQ
tara:strand:+ start:1086 stop:1235 length:150 start_codon:yes stop_codon:yes gene_type:complete